MSSDCNAKSLVVSHATLTSIICQLSIVAAGHLLGSLAYLSQGRINDKRNPISVFFYHKSQFELKSDTVTSLL